MKIKIPTEFISELMDNKDESEFSIRKKIADYVIMQHQLITSRNDELKQMKKEHDKMESYNKHKRGIK